jgi:GMP synthase-like glutamine amidotransferase
MKIGILECGHTMPEVESDHGTFPQMFARLLEGHGFNYAAYDVENMVFPADVSECDGWLLTGSKHGAYEDHAFIPPLEAFIRKTYAQGVPMVGICFGHQLIAQALGGRVEKYQDGWALGLTDYKFDGVGELALNAWHQDQVIERPEGAEPIASNGFCENAALIYGKKALTVQPHPEFGGEIVSEYVNVRRGTGTYPDALMDAALGKSSGPDDNASLAKMIADFFKAPREVSHV